MPDQVQCVRRPRPSPRPAPRCSSLPAHESLRKFVQSYSFGTTARPTADTSSSHSQTSQQHSADFASCGPDFAALSLRDQSRVKSSENKKLGTSLVFGENAPKTVELPVRERIGRKPVKKSREPINVDVLCAMVNDLEVVEDSEGKASKSWADILAKRRSAKTKRQKVERNDSPKKESNADQQTENSGAVVEDELSFLVERCNLDRENYQTNGFMPYIT